MCRALAHIFQKDVIIVIRHESTRSAIHAKHHKSLVRENSGFIIEYVSDKLCQRRIMSASDDRRKKREES